MAHTFRTVSKWQFPAGWEVVGNMRRPQERGGWLQHMVHSLQYMHYTAGQHVYSMYIHATPDPATYGLERHMASWLALRPSGA